MTAAATKRASGTLRRAFTSWRTAAVTLQSFPSALPLGLVLTTVPAWLATQGVDVKTIGFVSVAQAPWTFKFLWAPLMDRYAPPFLGRKRGWAVLAQAVLLVGTLLLAASALGPVEVWIIGITTCVIAFASASQDIAIDAYAVEVLHREEQGVAAGARAATARFALYCGRSILSAAQYVGWPAVFALQAIAYVPAMVLMYFSPEPDNPPAPPASLRDAVWKPLLGIARQPRALEIVLFVVLYKLGDNLASALVSAFLIQTGFTLTDVGVASASVGLVSTLIGSMLGGAITSAIGLGHSLWLFGFLQAFSNLGYIAVAEVGVNRPVLYGALAIEAGTSAMGTAAFSVLLLRLTEKRFSATQYAVLSSLFALGRTIAPPIAGVLIDLLGWSTFFALTIAAALPGMLMLQRFVPIGTREADFTSSDELRPASPRTDRAGRP